LLWTRSVGAAAPSRSSIVDRVFELEDTPAAFGALDDGEFFGKIVIRL